MRIQIKCLGRLEVFLDDQELVGFLDKPVRAALLLYLAVEKEVTREGAMALLWPDHIPDRARHTLSQTLYRLRQDLGQDWLDSSGDRLRIRDSVSVDVHEFRAALEVGEIPTALEQYQGPFLDGWFFPGTGRFEGWVDRVRIQLAREFREANRNRVGELKAAGDLARALQVASRWVEADPLEDEAQHSLLELLAESGDRAEALSRFEAYEQLLALDDLTPLDHTLALVQAIRAKEEVPVRTGAGSKSTPKVGSPRRAMWPIAAGVAGVVVVSATLLWAFRGLSRGPPLVANRVLVVPLENQTGDPALDPVGRLAADWINQGLSGTGFVEVVPSIEVVPGLRGEPGEATANVLAEVLDLARENQAGTVVYGTYYRLEEGLDFHLQVVSVATRDLLQVIGPVSSPSQDPMEVVDILRQRTMVALAVHLDARLEGMLGETTLPPSYESYLAFIEGFELFGRGRPVEAIPFFERSNQLSPEFTAPLIMKGFANYAIGKQAVAESLVAVVRVSEEFLTPYDRFRLDFLEMSLHGDLEGSLRATRAAAALQPGGSAHAAAGSQAQYLNRPRLALEILGTLNRDGVVGRVYTPLWNTLTTAFHSLGEHRQELKEAKHGRRVQPFSLAVLYFEIRALTALGRVEEVGERLEECVNFPEDSRGWTPPVVMLSAARELRAHGFGDASGRAVKKALDWYANQPEGEQRSEGHRRGLARALTMADRWEDARSLYQELETEAPDRIEYLGSLGVLAARLGDLDAARAYDSRLASLHDPYLFGSHTLWRARVAAQLGDSEASVGFLRSAFREGAAFPFDLLHTGPDFDPLRELPAFQEILRPKG